MSDKKITRLKAHTRDEVGRREAMGPPGRAGATAWLLARVVSFFSKRRVYEWINASRDIDTRGKT